MLHGQAWRLGENVLDEEFSYSCHCSWVFIVETGLDCVVQAKVVEQLARSRDQLSLLLKLLDDFIFVRAREHQEVEQIELGISSDCFCKQFWQI